MIVRRAYPTPPRTIDTTAVEARIRAEARDTIAMAREYADEGDMENAIFWADYTAALYGLLGSEWALMTIALQEIYP